MNVTPAFRRLILFGYLLALPLAVRAQSVTVNVNAGAAVRTVDERVFGLNAVMWDPEAGSAQTVTMLQAAGIRAIRVPGGSLSDEYHWNLNRSLNRDNPPQNHPWTWASGFNKFAGLITGLDAQAFVTVNYGSGTPEEAAAWVAYANAATNSGTAIGTDAKGTDWKTAGTWATLRAAGALATDDGMNFLRVGRTAAYGVKYWEIGNECYGAPWETDLQSLPHDPFTYATRAKEYIARMKAVDSSIKIGVVVVPSETQYANGYTAHTVTSPRVGATNGWTPVMLTTLKNLGVTPDFVIYHRYDQAPARDQPNNPESDAGLLQKAKTWPDDTTAIRRQLTDYLGATEGAKVEIVVTENNSVYSSPGKQTTSLVNGLFLADSIGHILQTEINALVWWDLRNGQDAAHNNSGSLYGWRNYGDYGILSTPSAGGSATYYDAYPTYYVMKLLAKFARGSDTVVTATSSSSLLTVFAVKSLGGDLRLLVLNKDPAAPTNASITLAGFTPAAAASVYSYGKTQDDAAKPNGSGAVDVASTTMNIGGATFTAAFAPYSATVISLAAGTTPTPPTTPVPTPPTTPPSSGGGGGGGGGAPSFWFVGILALLTAVRWSRGRLGSR